MLERNIATSVEGVIHELLQHHFMQVRWVASGLLWQRSQIKKQLPVFGLVEQLALSLALLAFAFSRGRLLGVAVLMSQLAGRTSAC